MIMTEATARKMDFGLMNETRRNTMEIYRLCIFQSRGRQLTSLTL